MSLKFGTISNKLVDAIERVVGSTNIFTEIFDRIPYSRDNCPYRWSEKFKFLPDIVVTPETVEQVAEVVKLANENRIPITQSGGRTGMSGGCVPKYGGILMDMKKMDKIIELNEEDLYVRVQPGITNLRLLNELERKGYLGPHEPGSSPSSTIGGSLSTSGVNYRQGVTGALIDEVLGLEVVLASGEVIRAGRNSARTNLGKSSVGYDLAHLFLGDFGSLGVKTEAVLKIIPLPETQEIHVVVFPDFESTLKAIMAIQRRRLPGIFTYTAYDREYMEKAVSIYGGEVYGGAVMIGIMGDAKVVDYTRREAEEIWKKHGGKDLGPEESKAEWENRYDVYPKMIAGLPRDDIKPAARWHYEDPTVNLSKLAQFLRKCHEIVKKYGFDDWGGEAWIYDQTSTLAAIMYGWNEKDEENWEKYCRCANEIVMVGIELGGSISNCLGYDGRKVGRHGLELLLSEYKKHELKTLVKIKKALDPNCIMNPGVMGLDELWGEAA
ncbi:MAG: FAD-binding oxidoreductase [Candidatus Bathyarchaeia archaeon]